MVMVVIFDLDLLKDLSLVVLASTIFAFLIAFPVIHFLYKFNITRRMTVDFTTLIEKRNLKIGVPVMGGLIIVLTVIIFNLLANPAKDSKGLFLTLFIFTLSAILGGADDIMNIFGFERAKQRAFSRTLTLIKVHKSLRKRIWLTITLPWEAYKRFFYMLGSNPGKGIQAHEKILVQSIAGLALGVGLYFFSSLEKPGLLWVPLFDFDLNIGILLIPFAWIAVLLMTNAVNLADGMDGLAASELMASFFGFLVIAILKDDERMSFLITTVLGSLIAYLYFNIPPARFQMGDVGSLAMGTLLATVAFMLKEPLMMLLISFPFVLTLLSAVIQGIGRRILGRRIFRMAPLQYHFQMKYGWSEEKVVMRLGLFSVVCMIVGLFVFTMR
jgi:UDP-N-acetylmuramyl pentapeptide phosphotransferase/UDP-N-acetylglucosamine-1-phosphate transferase